MAHRLSKQTQLRSYLLPNIEDTGIVLGRGPYGVVIEMKLLDGTRVAGKKIHELLLQSSYQISRFEKECLM